MDFFNIREKRTELSGKLKAFLRRFVPVSRMYTDQKFLDMEVLIQNRLSELLSQQQIQNKQLALQNEQLKFQKEQLEKNYGQLALHNRELEEQQKIVLCQNEKLDNQKRQLEFHVNVLEDLRKANREQKKSIDGVRQYIGRELQRRDGWSKRPAELRREAEGRPVWIIKCPAPEDDSRILWGDYAFALSLKKYLERLNLYVAVDTREDWDCEAGADVVVVLRGIIHYHPDRRNRHCLYIMWNISHPDMVTEQEYELYDVVCIGSQHYADVLRKKLKVPVISLLQCTDTELFYPAAEEQPAGWDYIFIGNSRGVARNCVMWAVEEGLPLRMWGSGWNRYLKDHMEIIEAPSVENAKIPDLYRAAKVTLNDHWEDMREKQFVNNRIFDALACGLPVISDCCEELKEIFPDAVLCYKNKEDFRECVRRMEAQYGEIKKAALAQRERIQTEFSFSARARELAWIAEQYGNNNDGEGS